MGKKSKISKMVSPVTVATGKQGATAVNFYCSEWKVYMCSQGKMTFRTNARRMRGGKGRKKKDSLPEE
jgi:hypothetical protein